MSLLHYTLHVLTSETGGTVLFECQAESLPHAIEQAHDAYAGSKVLGMRGMPEGVDLMHFGYTVHQDNDRPKAWYYHNRLGERSDTTYLSQEEASHAALSDALRVMYESAMRVVGAGGTVWWDDPDNGASSGFYRVIATAGEVVLIQNELGSTAEVLPHELSYRRSA